MRDFLSVPSGYLADEFSLPIPNLPPGNARRVCRRGTDGRRPVPIRFPIFRGPSPYLPHGMIGTVEMLFIGEPSISRVL